MRYQEFVTEYRQDDRQGLGAVPKNADIDYFGLRVSMKPSTFLKLALPLNMSQDDKDTVAHIQQHLDNPGIGAPFLDLEIPESWEQSDFKKPAKISGHDGRHRMLAIMQTQGDDPVEVHLFPRYYRRRDFNPQWMSALSQGVISQRGQYHPGPWFDRAINESQNPAYENELKELIAVLDKNIAKLAAAKDPQLRDLYYKFKNQKKQAQKKLEKLIQPLQEINDDDELSISQRIQDYFTDRGYGYLGEGRDQIAFLSPRGTVVKVVGIGEDEREDIVKTYVGFFMRNQRNPHYPRIYNAGDFTVDGETYFVYEMEYLHPVSGEERVLEYIEDLMNALPRGEQALQAFYKNKKRPPELSEQQVDGLVMATQDLEDAIGGQAPLDLRSIENLGRRKDGQIVIIDPFSL